MQISTYLGNFLVCKQQPIYCMKWPKPYFAEVGMDIFLYKNIFLLHHRKLQLIMINTSQNIICLTYCRFGHENKQVRPLKINILGNSREHKMKLQYVTAP